MIKLKINYYKNSCIYGDFLKKNDWFIFLDSCNDISGFGNYDILSCNPNTKILANGNNINVIEDGDSSCFYDKPIDIIKKYYDSNAIDSDLPFNKGMIGYFGYDAFNYNDFSSDEIFPDIVIGYYEWAIIVNHSLEEAWITFEVKNNLIESIIDKFSNKNLSVNPSSNYSFSDFKQNTSKEKYINDVLKIKDYIKNGDCYQVNYSQNFDSSYTGEPWDIYKDLRKYNPAPYSSFFNFDGKYIISSSPERFISINNNIVETKPIKGTLKRLKDELLDEKQKNILRNDTKNIAENLMIVDLLRNDLSKCCLLNTVKVNKLFDIESYTSVHHMVSTIVGKLTPNITSIDVLEACFPGGSITGAPKKRSMEIINELENRRRGIYCGSIGYFDVNNNMDTNICIRTIMMHRNKLCFAAGGGIVHDSDPSDEYYESLEKVSVFIKLFSNGKFKW